jgi:diguanylate cyclase (GGDEF)-like protein/PAS domain S-box-containing protein
MKVCLTKGLAMEGNFMIPGIVLASLHEGLYITDRNRKIVFWNRAAEHITGYSSDEVVGTSCSDNILVHVDESGNNLCLNGCPISKAFDTQSQVEAKVFLHHKLGHRVPVQVRTLTIPDDNGAYTHGVELFSDLSNEELIEKRLESLEKAAFLDYLTKLPNRNYLVNELEKKLFEFDSYAVPFGVLFFDIDNFKQVNDTYGHDVGDEILQVVARNLTANSRPFDIFGRWGGEEFVGIIQNVAPKTLLHIGERIRQLVQDSFIQSHEKIISVTISIGATLATQKDTHENVVKRADLLMYKSKKAGKNRITMD